MKNFKFDDEYNKIINKIINNNLKYHLKFEDVLNDILAFSKVSYSEISNITNIPIRVLKEISDFKLNNEDFDLLIEIFDLDKSYILNNFNINILDFDKSCVDLLKEIDFKNYKLTDNLKLNNQLIKGLKKDNGFSIEAIQSFFNSIKKNNIYHHFDKYSKTLKERNILYYMLIYFIKYIIFKEKESNNNSKVLYLNDIKYQIDLLLKGFFDINLRNLEYEIINFFELLNKDYIDKEKDIINLDVNIINKIKDNHIYNFDKLYDKAITITV